MGKRLGLGIVFIFALGLTQGCNLELQQAIKKQIQAANPGGLGSPSATPTAAPIPTWSTFTAKAGTTSYRNKGSIASVRYGFVEYLPDGYASAPAGYYPLVIFLHGIGEIGTSVADTGNDANTMDLDKFRLRTGSSAGPQYSIDNGRYYNAVVISPQVPNGDGWWNSGEIDKLVTWALANYKVNPKRLLVTGLSMGGGGTWDYVTAYASKVAAVMPICGASGCAASTGTGIYNNGVKVWSFHAMDDGTVGVGNSYSCMNKIGTAYGQVQTFETNIINPAPNEQTGHFNNLTKRWEFEAQVDCEDSQNNPWPLQVCQTLYKTGGHGIWGRVYQHTTNLPMIWLLNQKKP